MSADTMKLAVARQAAPASGYAVRVENDLDFLSEEYSALFHRSGATAFQSGLWLTSIYATLAPRLGASPVIITVRDRTSDALMMVIPLVLQRSIEISILQPADLGVSDYNAIVAAPETMEALAADAAFRKDLHRALAAGDVLIFRKIQRSSGPTASILGDGRKSRNENDGFETDLTGENFDAWQKASLKKKFRSGTNRRMRDLRAAHASVDYATFTRADEIEAAIRFIAANRSARFDDDIIAQDAYLDFYLSHALAGAAGGEAVTTGLIVDGKLIAANFGIVSGNVYHSLLCAALFEEFGQYAPGLQSTLELMRRRQERGEVRFDFGIGNSRHKTDLAAQPVPLFNLTVSRSLSGQMVSLVYNQAKPLKTALRKLFGGIR